MADAGGKKPITLEDFRRLAPSCHDQPRQQLEALIDTTRERMLEAIGLIRDHNGLDDEDGFAVAAGKAAVLALCTVLENAARAGPDGVAQQRDIAFEIGRLFGIVVKARGLSAGGARLMVEDLAADFGAGAYRATIRR